MLRITFCKILTFGRPMSVTLTVALVTPDNSYGIIRFGISVYLDSVISFVITSPPLCDSEG